MNTHSALYWRQRNAPLNFIFDKGNAEQESQFRKQVFTSIKNEILFLPVISLPCASATLWDIGVELDWMVNLWRSVKRTVQETKNK